MAAGPWSVLVVTPSASPALPGMDLPAGLGTAEPSNVQVFLTKLWIFVSNQDTDVLEPEQQQRPRAPPGPVCQGRAT